MEELVTTTTMMATTRRKKTPTTMKHPLLYILLLMAASVFAGCTSEWFDVATDDTTEAPIADRAEVAVSFDATLGTETPDSRAAYTYSDGVAGGNGGKGVKTTWKKGDALGVYIKTTDGTILRAGSIVNTAVSDGGTTQHFEGRAFQLFEGEHYIYMHPDIGRKTYVNLESQNGHLNSTDHIADHLPIVWDESTTGQYLGYILHLTLDFQSVNPGQLKKVTLLTQRRSDEDRIFPRHYDINSLANSSVIPFDAQANSSVSGTPTGLQTSSTDFTHAITLNVTGGTVTDDGDGTYSTEVYLTSSQVEHLNLYSSYVYALAVNDADQPFASTSISFKGQGSAPGRVLLSSGVLPNGTVRKMTATMSPGSISSTLINSQYKVFSIMGMWNEYGRPYDPNNLMVYAGGNATLPAIDSGTMPTQLIQNMPALRDRSLKSLTGEGLEKNTPTHTWVFYESQCDGYKNNYMILNDGGANSDHGTDHSQANTTINNITIMAPTKVYLTFLNEFAWWQNLIGYYHYPEGNVPASPNEVAKNIILPNVSKPGNEPFNTNTTSQKPDEKVGKDEDAPLNLGETIKLLYTRPDGTVTDEFPAGTVIGFFLMANAQANGFQTSGFNLMNWTVPTHYSNSAWNTVNPGWPTTGRRNTFASADICNVASTDNNYKAPQSTKIPGIAFYGAMDDIKKNGQNTAWSAMLYAISTSDPAAMQTHNRMYFNIGTGNTAVLKQNVDD